MKAINLGVQKVKCPLLYRGVQVCSGMNCNFWDGYLKSYIAALFLAA
jgi:hypothetical protein